MRGENVVWRFTSKSVLKQLTCNSSRVDNRLSQTIVHRVKHPSDTGTMCERSIIAAERTLRGTHTGTICSFYCTISASDARQPWLHHLRKLNDTSYCYESCPALEFPRLCLSAVLLQSGLHVLQHVANACIHSTVSRNKLSVSTAVWRARESVSDHWSNEIVSLC